MVACKNYDIINFNEQFVLLYKMMVFCCLYLQFFQINCNFENAIKLLSYKSSVPLSLKVFVNRNERERMVKEKHMVAYSYFSSAAGYINLDVLLDVPVSFEEMWQSRTEKGSENSALPLVSLEHLIQLKTYANRIQDQKDILLLSKLLR